MSVPLVVEYESALLRNMSPGQRPSHVTAFVDYLCLVAHKQDVFFLWRPLLNDPNDEAERRDMYRIADYFSVGLGKDEPFSFEEYSYVQGARDLVMYFLQARRIPPSQRDMIFMTRVVLGYYEYFSRAKSRLNFHQMVKRWAHQGWRGRTIAIPPYTG